MTRLPRLAALGVVGVALVSACATGRGSSTLPSATEALLLDPVARARADSARLPWTKADVDFMTGMIGHHAQAITMSRMAPKNGASQQVLTLSARIINAQQDEIRVMQLWLKDRNQPVPNPDAPATDGMAGMTGMSHAGHDMSAMGGAGHAAMPGMLTDAQLKELEAARGAEFDKLFLKYMIQHHEGATSMVKTLFDTPGAGQDEAVFKFASDVNVDQSTEIARMQRMLFMLQVEKPD